MTLYFGLDVTDNQSHSVYAEFWRSTGEIVGTVIRSGGAFGFLYCGGVFTTIDVPGAGKVSRAATRANGINARGEIVGDFDVQTETLQQPMGTFYRGGMFTIIDFPLLSLPLAKALTRSARLSARWLFPVLAEITAFLRF